MNSEVLSIEDAFGNLSDPRSRTPVHGLTQRLLVALCAMLAGADSWAGIELWGQAKLDWLRGHVRLKNGIASHDPFGRVFAALDLEPFEACLKPTSCAGCAACARHWQAKWSPSMARPYV
ncbi:transposase family protein, partial [Pandoraea sputorum]|uniref:transposase family protein n=1 Tax=Pandoraea sputorum TaxID=93222 RepID=UPI0012429DB1